MSEHRTGGRGSMAPLETEFEIRAGETPFAHCQYCDYPFPTEQQLVLHRGVAHEDRLDADEQAAYEQARAAEDETLSLFRLKALFALVILYFTFLMVYGVVT